MSNWTKAFLCLPLLWTMAADAQWFDDYKSLAEYHAKLDEFVADYPSLASVSTIGQSWEGRDIRALKITGTGGGNHKKAVAINGLQHAREWITGMTTMYVADQLLQGYGANSRVTSVLDEVEFYVIPVMNPDGYEFSRTPGQRYWRKNRRPGFNARGVDLNRNWDYEWGNDAGSSPDPFSDLYRGPSAFSEPETQAMRDFFLDNQHIVSHSDVHAYSQLILTPWGYTENELPPDHDMFQQVAATMADSIFSVHGEVYEYGPTAPLLYIVSGGSHDWVYGDQGAYSLTFELRPESFSPGFDLPPSEIIPTGEEIFPAMLDLAEFTATLARGDFDYSQSHTCDDIDLLYDAIQNGSNKAEFDMNGDGSITPDDIDVWLAESGEANLVSGASFLPGDANFDGNVDGTDFLVWNDHKFTSTDSWCSGDFNADGEVNGGDFLIWNDNKFQSVDGLVVPEAVASWVLLAIVACHAGLRRRRG